MSNYIKFNLTDGANIDPKCAGASETASNQGAGEGEADVLSEAKGGSKGCQIQVQREGISNILNAPFIGKSDSR